MARRPGHVAPSSRKANRPTFAGSVSQSWLPSRITRSGTTSSWASARVPASRSAAMMPIASISAGEAWPTAQARAHRRIGATIRSRAAAVSSLESLTPTGADRQVSSMTTTPTETGPASAPRPTSSIPHNSRCPCRCRARSTRREGLPEGGRAAITSPARTASPRTAPRGPWRTSRTGSPSQLQSDSGQTTVTARPTMSRSGTEPWLPSPPRGWNRESEESDRWSPMTHTRPAGTVMSKACRLGESPGLRYGSLTATPLTLSGPPWPSIGDVVAGQADDALDQVVALVVWAAGRRT